MYSVVGGNLLPPETIPTLGPLLTTASPAGLNIIRQNVIPVQLVTHHHNVPLVNHQPAQPGIRQPVQPQQPFFQTPVSPHIHNVVAAPPTLQLTSRQPVPSIVGHAIPGTRAPVIHAPVQNTPTRRTSVHITLVHTSPVNQSAPVASTPVHSTTANQAHSPSVPVNNQVPVHSAPVPRPHVTSSPVHSTTANQEPSPSVPVNQSNSGSRANVSIDSKCYH